MPLIYAAPASGVSTWCSGSSIWADGTLLACSAGLHSDDWHRASHTSSESASHFRAIDAFFADRPEGSNENLVSTVFWETLPAAIVIIDRDTHMEYNRSGPKYPESVIKNTVLYLKQISNRYKIPTFPTFDIAANYFADN